MKGFVHRFFLVLVGAIFIGKFLCAQVPVNINSGNPNFPFPQFLEYSKGKTLAKYNGEGVTHADMEKAMREGYQVMANHFRYTGASAGGVQYIKGNLGCPYDCAEGEGYAMLAAAYMGDQVTFNGLWMRVHDDMVTKVPRYRDGINTWPTYRYGVHTIKEGSGDAAADGDYDIALALLVATKQWGSLSGVTVNNGSGGTKNMSYLEEAKNIITELADTVGIDDGSGNGIDGYLSGHIGHDGYPKGGNTFGENTDWGLLNGSFRPSVEVPSNDYNQDGFASYIAPAYFRSFATFLQANGGSPWCIEQFKRAEASTEWLMAQSYVQNRLPYAGAYDVQGTSVVFKDGDPTQGKSKGEAFRMPWRTILNYVWRGDGIYNWNPTTHQYSLGTNTAMHDNANRLASFFKNPGVCSSLGSSPDPVSTTVNHKGIAQIVDNILGSGTMVGPDKINFSLGTASPSAVAFGDETLIAELYRQCELKWDDVNKGLAEKDTIIVESESEYFHGWFRMLGMMVLSGNYHAPEDIVAGANMKVYVSVDKTFAFTGDQITYTVDYRNYGKNDASNVVISIPVSAQYKVVNNGGGTLSGSNLTFNIGAVPGFKSATGIAPTAGKKTFTVKVLSPKAVDRVCQVATITASNGSGWTSNEYPNNATYNMQRNCVDILKNRSLVVEKTPDKTEVNPGSDVTFTLVAKNSSDGGWLNGGRKNVNFSYAYAEAGPNSYFHLFRNWNNAQEAYINLANYRVSYFMFDNVNKGIYNAATNPFGWTLIGKNLQTGLLADFDFKGQPIPVGDNAGKKWDQRLIIKFPADITEPTHAVLSHLGNRYQLHKGALRPIWYSVQMESNPPSALFSGRVQDDWSYKSSSFKMAVGSGAEPYFLIGPNYADPTSSVGLVMDRFDKDACTAIFTPDKIYDKLLVEEFDGYTWRRVSGEGPLPGREMYDVLMVDTIPLDFKFVKFTDDTLAGVKATMTVSGGREIVKWTVPVMLVGIYGDIKYVAKAQGTCPGMPDKKVSNTVWISSSTDSPTSSSAEVKLTCAFVTPPVSGTTMTKISDKATYTLNENINYTVKFKQTIGTTSRPAMSDATRWSAIDGSASDLPIFGAAAIDFKTKNALFIKEKYSHGKNGTLIAEIDHDGQEIFGFVFRYKSGQRPATAVQGIYVEMQLAYWGAMAGIKIWENGVLKYTVAPEAYAAPFDKAKIKFELIDGTLKLWLNDIAGLPFKTFTGFTSTDAGFAGFAQGDAAKSSSVWSAPKILNWDAHFDSAFDLEVSDPLPTSVTFVSASASGTYSAPRVKWPKRAGPVLYNDSVEYTVVAKLTACPANGKIINIAYVNAFGLTVDSIGAQNVATCGAVVSTLLPGSIGAKQIICGGTTPKKINNLTIASGGTPPYTYQWESSLDSSKWDPIASATDTAYAPGVLAATKYFRRKVTDATTFAYTAGLKITVSGTLSAGIISAAQIICYNQLPSKLTSTADASGGTPPYNYQWQESADSLVYVDITAATAKDYAPAALTETRWYRRNITGTLCGTISTLPVKIIVNPDLTSGSVGADQTVCSAVSPDSIKNILLPTGGTGAYNFQWQMSPDNSAWTAITGATSKSYLPAKLPSTAYFRRRVISGTCDTAWSASVKVDVTPSVTANVLVNDPGAICSGESVVLEATPTMGGTAPAYQWYLNGVAVVGATTDTYTSNALKNGDSLKVILTSNEKCVSNSPVSSNKILISVTSALVPKVAIASDLGTAICAGTSVKFSLGIRSGQGNSPTYKWFLNGVNTGLSDTSYSPLSIKNDDSVYVEMTSSSTCASVKTVNSSALKMKVNSKQNPDVQITADNTTICSGKAVNFKVSSRANAGTTPTFQWQLNGVNIVGKTDSMFSTTTLKNGDAVSVIMKSNATCINKTSDTSNVVPITVGAGAVTDVVVNDPGAACAGTAIAFKASVQNGGANPSFAWLVNGVPNVSSDSNFTTTFKNSDVVKVVVTSSLTCTAKSKDTSNTVTINIIAAPKAAVISYKGPFCKGTASANVDVVFGSGSLGVFSSATGLAIDAASGKIDIVNSTAGTYSVKNKVSNSCGGDSSTTTVVVNDAAVADVSYGGPFCQSAGTANPVFVNGGIGGVFTAKAGLKLNASSGAVDLLGSSAGTYIVTNTIAPSGGCAQISDTALVVIYPSSPSANFSYSSLSLCASAGSAKVKLAAGASAGIFLASPVGLTINSVDGTIDLTTSSAGKYTITNDIAGVAGCGSASATQNVEISLPAKANFSYPDKEYCKDSISISPIFSAGSISGKFNSSAGLVIDSVSGIVNIGASSAGIYYISNTIAAVGGCAVIVSNDTLEIVSAPHLKVSDDLKIPRGKTVQLQGSGASTYLWTPATDLSCTTCSSPSAKPSENITYVVSGSNKNCSSRDTVNIIVEDCSEVFVPNAFNTKSVHEENAKLCVYGSCIESMHLVVFDRWGEKVFETKEQSLCWDGLFRNVKMNSGEFVFVLEAVLIGGEVIHKRGNLSLME